MQVALEGEQGEEAEEDNESKKDRNDSNCSVLESCCCLKEGGEIPDKDKYQFLDVL